MAGRARDPHRSTGDSSTPRPTASSSTTSAARGALRRSASCARTRRRISSPTSSACANRSASSAGWCSAARGARRWPSRTRSSIPARCLGLVLRGIFLCRRSEIDWFLYGLRAIFPEPWERFAGFLPPAERGDLLGNYYRRLVDPDPAVHMPAARAWSVYEGSCSTLLPIARDGGLLRGRSSSRSASRASRRITSGNDIFLPENALLANAGRLRGIPGVIVQGRYDIVCPIVSARRARAPHGRRRSTRSSPTPATRRGSPASARHSSPRASGSSAVS